MGAEDGDLSGADNQAFDCDELRALQEAMANGYSPGPSQLRAKQLHLVRCEDCRLVARAELAMLAGHGGAEPTLEPLARRKWVAQIVDAVPPIAGGRKAESRRFVLRWSWAIPAAATAAVAAFALSLHWREPNVAKPTASNPVARTAPTAAQAAPVAKTLLAVGTPQGLDSLRSGESLTIEDGRRVLALSPAIRLAAEANTRLRLERLDAKRGVVVRLHTGSVFVSVKPNAAARLAIFTPSGRIDVVGTVFSVDVDPSTVELRVLRGKVRTQAGPKVSPIMVSSQRALTLGQRRLRRLRDAEIVTQKKKLAAIQLLSDQAATSLSITSIPTGADVWLGDQHLGQTPLSALVSAESRRLRLTRDGYQPKTIERDPSDTRAVTRAITLKSESSDRRPEPTRIRRSKVIRSRSTRASVESSPATAQSSSPTRAAPGVEELLVEAQSKRIARQWQQAALAYRRLIQTHGRSPQGQAARISLAEIQLDQLGQPKAALRNYEAYLAHSHRGALAQEAALGRIQALRRLGRHQEEKRAILAFLRRYPDTVMSDDLSSRLGELGAAGH